MYGKRDGTMPGLAIVSRIKQSLHCTTKGWKTGTILSVPMLQRNEMSKPSAVPWPAILCPLSCGMWTSLLWSLTFWTVFGPYVGTCHAPVKKHLEIPGPSKVRSFIGVLESRLLDFRDLPAFQVSPTKTSNPLPHMGRAFTDVQELRQVRGRVCRSACFLLGRPTYYHPSVLSISFNPIHSK